MANFEVKGKALNLIGNPEDCTYSVEFCGQKWTMSERPFVLFSDDTKIPFPTPDSQGEFSTGTSKGIEAVYTDFPNHKITLKTKAEIEISTDDVYFTLIVTGDEKCEIKKVSFPAPFDFGPAFSDKGDLAKNNLPESYSVLSRMQGCLVPAGTKICLSDGKVFERDGYMPIFAQIRKNTG